MSAVNDHLKDYLARQGLEVMEFAAVTATAETAAAAVGCTVAEIAKTLLFLIGDRPVAVVTCGDHKVKSSPLKKAAGISGKVRLPDADEVIRYTGYAPGGVCPFLLPAELPVLLDTSMQRFSVVFAAAGNSHSAVPVSFRQLEEITGGSPASVCQAAATD